MLDTLFYFILNMSFTSCFVIAALLLIRQIKPLPRRVVYPLWALAFFRLLMPFTLPTGFSLFNFTGGLVKRLITVETVTQSLIPLPASEALSAMNMIGAAQRYAPVEYRTESLRQIFTTASAVWAVIAAVALLAALILYALTQKELREAVRIEDGLYRSSILLSPVLSGIVRPKIILPDSLDPQSAEGQMIIAHENVHKRRLDNLWRMLAIPITCLHWFNPFAWIMLKAFFSDMEQSCDEAVVRKYSMEERRTYAETLLRFAEHQRIVAATAFGRLGVKTRIVNVLNYRKLTLIGAVISSLFLLALAAALITNPQLRG